MSVDRNSQPIFILGNHRSGTSILYKTLVEKGRFAHPTPFHLAHFDDYLDGGFDPGEALDRTRERFERRGIVDRFVDDIPAHALSPEEYGFVLKGGRITSGTLSRFKRFCEFTAATSEPGQPLLLKNPRDFNNAETIRHCFPRARFIFIHRHPGPTIESRIRELRLLFSSPSPYQAEIEPGYERIMSNPALRGILSFCLRPKRMVELCFLYGFRRRALQFLRSLERLPAESYTTLTYEDLCADPERVIGDLLRFLERKPDDLSGLEEMIRARPAPPNESRVLRSETAVRMLGPYLRHCGYEGLWPVEKPAR
jgi:hypothetical protein